MGSFGTGFLSALGDTLHQRAAQVRDQELKKKELEAQYHWGALQEAAKRGGQYVPDPNDPSKTVFKAYTPEDYQHMLGTTMDNLTKAYGSSKPVKDIMQRAQHLIGQVTGHPLWGMEHRTDTGSDASPDAQPAGSAAQAQANPAPASPQSTSLAIPAPPGSGAASPTAALTGTGDGKSATQATDAAPTPAPVPAVSSAASGPTDGMQAADQIEGSVAAAPAPDLTAALAGPAPRTDAALTPDASIPPSAPAAPPAAPPAPTTASPRAAPGANLTPQQMLSSFQNPFDAARMQQEIGLQGTQRIFEQQQAQHAAVVANLEQQLGRKLTPTEVERAWGMQFPASFFTPHFDSKPVLASNWPAGATSIDGKTQDQVDPNSAWHVATVNGEMKMVPMNYPMQKQAMGNIEYWVDPYTHEVVGPVSNLPVRVPTNTGTTSPLNVLLPNGQWAQLPGARTNTPQTFQPPAPSAGAAKPTAPGATAPGATPSPAAALTPPARGTGGAGTAPKAKTGSPTPAPSTGGIPRGARVLPPGAIPAAQVQGQQRRDTAINVAGQGLQQFAQPHDDGLSNLDVFKDPNAVKRIAQYINLNNAQIEGEFEQAEKGGAEGVLSFYAGLPQAYKSVSNQAVRDAYAKLSPHDQRFVTDYYNLIGQWGGMRSATGASASKYSFQNLAQEIPNPVSMSSYTQARQKVANMLHELSGISEPNTSIRKYNEDEILPPQTSNKVIPPPPGTKYSVQDPDGNTHYFTTKAEADTMRKLIKDAQEKQTQRR
jgi:hypothetical protein